MIFLELQRCPKTNEGAVARLLGQISIIYQSKPCFTTKWSDESQHRSQDYSNSSALVVTLLKWAVCISGLLQPLLGGMQNALCIKQHISRRFEKSQVDDRYLFMHDHEQAILLGYLSKMSVEMFYSLVPSVKTLNDTRHLHKFSKAKRHIVQQHEPWRRFRILNIVNGFWISLLGPKLRLERVFFNPEAPRYYIMQDEFKSCQQQTGMGYINNR